MSVLFECNGEKIWFPSNGPAWMWVDQIASLERWLGQPSGVGAIESDMCEIDAATFVAFVQRALAELERTNHRILFALASGCVEVAISLNARITGEWPVGGEQTGILIQQARTVMQQPLWYYRDGERVRLAPPE